MGKMSHTLSVGISMRTIAVLLAVSLGLLACSKEAADASAPAAGPYGDAVSAPPAEEAPQPAADGSAPGPTGPEADETAATFKARGNEPFWSVQVEGTTLTYATPELLPGKVLQAQRQNHATGVTFSGQDDGGAFTLDIERRPCQDTMSDESFEFTATFRYGGQTLQGCASRGP